MNLSLEIECPGCGSQYNRVQLIYPSPAVGEQRCVICGAHLETWAGHRRPTYNLVARGRKFVRDRAGVAYSNGFLPLSP